MTKILRQVGGRVSLERIGHFKLDAVPAQPFKISLNRHRAITLSSSPSITHVLNVLAVPKIHARGFQSSPSTTLETVVKAALCASTSSLKARTLLVRQEATVAIPQIEYLMRHNHLSRGVHFFFVKVVPEDIIVVVVTVARQGSEIRLQSFEDPPPKDDGATHIWIAVPEERAHLVEWPA